MSDSPDSWEKETLDRLGQVIAWMEKLYEGCDPLSDEVQALHTLRALRERDEKRWERAKSVQYTLEHHAALLESTDPEQAMFWRGLASMLREARELP